MAMMFRGLGKPTDQLDIQLAQPSASEFSGNLGFAPMPAPPAPEPQKMGTGRMIAGYIGDALAQLGGMRGNFMPAMQQHQEMMRRAQQQQAQRQAEREDWLWKQEWERANPAPRAPTEFERMLEAAGFSDAEKLSLIQQRARNTADPMQAVTTYGPDGSQGLQFIRPSQMVGGAKGGGQGVSPSPGSASPNPAIGTILPDPRKAGAGSGQGGFRP